MTRNNKPGNLNADLLLPLHWLSIFEGLLLTALAKCTKFVGSSSNMRSICIVSWKQSNKRQ